MVGGMRSIRIEVSGVELVRRLADKTGGTAFPLYAPLLVRTPAMAQELRSNPSLAGSIERFKRLSVALVGIGSWRPPRSSLYSEFSEHERDVLIKSGAVADVCAIVLDSEGAQVRSDTPSRAVGITHAELEQVPEVIAIAGGDEKVQAIAAVLRSGLVNTLITESQTALALLGRR